MKRERSYGSIVRNIIQYKHNSILVRNFALVIIMMIVPFVILTLLVKSNLENIVHQEIREVNDNSLKTVSETLDTVMDKMFSFAYYFKRRVDFPLFYQASAEEMEAHYREEYLQIISMNILVEEYIDSVYLYMENRELILYTSKSDSVGSDTLESMKDLTWLPCYEECVRQNKTFLLDARIKNDRYPYLMTMVVPFEKGSSSRKGAIIINVDMKKLDEYLGLDTREDQNFYIVGEEGELYYSNVRSLVETSRRVPDALDFAWQEKVTTLEKEMNGTTYIVSVDESCDWQCRYILCTPIDRFENRMKEIDRFVAQIVLLISGLAIVVAYIVTIHSYVPIRQIMEEINNDDKAEEEILELENLNEKKRKEFNNELTYITNMVRQSKNRNDRFHLETRSWMEKLKSAQMVALQSQINPHYLYNSLDMINWRSVELLGYNNTISIMISTLAQFFRLGLQRTGYLICISEELEHAKMYTKMLEERYRGSIHIKWDVAEEILSCEIIRLTLQPLIENAIHHGLRPKRYEGNITISGGRTDTSIYLEVEDDGGGMAPDVCAKLNYELMNQYDEDSTHIGIRNVNQRIKIMFGDEYGVNLMPGKDGGLKVKMLLPGNTSRKE